jgi:hypothetical protein
MAILNSAVWEFRETGSNNNGGGFDTGIAGYGTDYTQQDTAQLELTDLACTTGTSTLTSTTGGFTSAMIGNCIYIRSGTNFTVGWYFIIGYTNTNTVTLDRTPVGGTNGSSGSGNVGGARAVPTDTFFESLAGGNVVYFKKGTYTFTESVILTSTSPHSTVIGYNSTRNDTPIGDNRPLFTMGAFSFTSSKNYIQNIRFVGTASFALSIASGGRTILYNVKSDNQSTLANRAAMNNSGPVIGTGIELYSMSGSALNIQDSICFTTFWFRDSIQGATILECFARRPVILMDGVVSSCITGIHSIAQTQVLLKNITSANCKTHLLISGAGSDTFRGLYSINNNIYLSGTSGVLGLESTGTYNTMLYNNIFDGLTTNINGIYDNGNIYTNPFLNSPSTNDFSVTSLSTSIIESGRIESNYIGLNGNYRWNIGFAQGNTNTPSISSEYSNVWVS